MAKAITTFRNLHKILSRNDCFVQSGGCVNQPSKEGVSDCSPQRGGVRRFALWAVETTQVRGVLDDHVELSRNQEVQSAQPEPAHQHDNPGERAVGGAVVAPM